MIGLVLSGGESKRMKRDKGLIPLDQSTWVQRAESILEPFCDTVYFSIREAQKKSYGEYIPKNKIVQDLETLPIFGPLRGVISAHRQFPTEDILLLAVDMVNMQKVVIQNLVETSFKSQESAFCYHYENQQIEPLLGLLRTESLQRIEKCIQDECIPNLSMIKSMKLVNAKYLKIPKIWKNYFENINIL